MILKLSSHSQRRLTEHLEARARVNDNPVWTDTQSSTGNQITTEAQPTPGGQITTGETSRQPESISRQEKSHALQSLTHGLTAQQLLLLKAQRNFEGQGAPKDEAIRLAESRSTT